MSPGKLDADTRQQQMRVRRPTSFLRPYRVQQTPDETVSTTKNTSNDIVLRCGIVRGTALDREPAKHVPVRT